MTTTPSDWRDCPFVVGSRYRTRKEFHSPRDTFLAGEVLTFERTSYSWYDNLTGFFFRDVAGRVRGEDLEDGTDLDVLNDLFQESTE